MDRNDLQDINQWDLHQNLTEYASHVCPSYSVKIILKYLVVFFQDILFGLCKWIRTIYRTMADVVLFFTKI